MATTATVMARAVDYARERFPLLWDEKIEEFLAETPETKQLHFTLPKKVVWSKVAKNDLLLLPQDEIEQIEIESTEEASVDYRRERLDTLLQCITPTQRRVVEMHFIDDFDTKKIAKIEGVCEGDIKLCLHYSIEKMRSEAREKFS